jgi:protein O-GlcNAc transferase
VTELAELRAGLRDRLRQSPLTDSKKYTANLEQAYRQMWRNRLATTRNPAATPII